MALTLSSFQVYPTTRLRDSPPLTLRLWYSQEFLDVNGNTVLPGPTDFYISFDCSITSNVITVNAEDIFTTLDAQIATPQSIQVSARFFSGNTAKDFLFTNWFIPAEDGYPGGVITFEQLTIENEASIIVNPPAVYWTSAQVQAYFNTLTTNNNASPTVKGITYLSVAAASTTHPLAVGKNDYASTTNLGVVKLSVAPASASAPIALGANDPAVPSLATPLPVTYGGTGTGTWSQQGGVVFYKDSTGKLDGNDSTFTWDYTNHKLVVGSPYTNTITSTLLNADLVVASSKNLVDSGITSAWFGTGIAGSNAALVNLNRARGTPSAATTIVTGDTVGMLNFQAYTGSGFIQSASIRVDSTGTIAATRAPSQMKFYTSTDATPSVQTLALTIDETQIGTFTQQLRTKSISTTGSAGAGFLESTAQSATALSTIGNGSIRLYSYRPLGTYGRLSWTQSDGFTRQIICDFTASPVDGGPLTADRFYTFPNANATLVQADAGASNNFLTAISTNGVISKAQPTEANISFSDITTNNSSTLKHGYLPKLSGSASDSLKGDGSWSPAGGLSGLTTNLVPKATSSTAIGNSSITDNGAQVIFTEPIDLRGSSVNFSRWTKASNGSLNLQALLLAPAALSASLVADATGVVTAGTHSFKMTYVTAGGETDASPVSNTVTADAAHTKITITIPTGSDQYTTNTLVTGRNIYATAAGGSTYFLVAASPVVNNNTDTTYTFNIADGSFLATQAPTTNSALDTRVYLDNLGNVGIGLTALSVTDDAQGRTLFVDGGAGAPGYVEVGASITNTIARTGLLAFYNRAMAGVDHRVGYICGYNDGALGQGSLTFATTPTTVGPVERMKIAYDGTIRMGSVNTSGGTLAVTAYAGNATVQSWYDSTGPNLIGSFFTNGRFVVGGNVAPTVAFSVGSAEQFNVTSGGVATAISLNVGNTAIPTLGKLNIAPKTGQTYSNAMTIDVTNSNQVLAVSFTTSGTSTWTPSAAGTAGDLLLLETTADASGTVTVTFAASFKTSGTQATTASHFSSILFISTGSAWLEVARTTNLA